MISEVAKKWPAISYLFHSYIQKDRDPLYVLPYYFLSISIYSQSSKTSMVKFGQLVNYLHPLIQIKRYCQNATKMHTTPLLCLNKKGNLRTENASYRNAKMNDPNWSKWHRTWISYSWGPHLYLYVFIHGHPHSDIFQGSFSIFKSDA